MTASSGWTLRRFGGCLVAQGPLGRVRHRPESLRQVESGWKWSVACDGRGIPLVRAAAAADRPDAALLEPALDAVAARGLLEEVDTPHLDRGYDSAAVGRLRADKRIREVDCPRWQVPQRPARPPQRSSPGKRWIVERTNSWLSNFGQLRPNTDRTTGQRLGQLALAITVIIAIKLVKWADRHNR